MSDYSMARLNMVESQIRPNQVTDSRIISAMRDIPRETFVPASLRGMAYMDEEISFESTSLTAGERHLIAPMTLARLVQAASIGSEDVVLDVGCATGYSCAVLSRIAEAVVGLECDTGLAEMASNNLMALEIDNAAIVTGELAKGYPEEGPYDAIILQGSVPDAPEILLSQVKRGGRLVSVIGGRKMGQAIIYRNIDGDFTPVSVFDAGAPPLPGFKHAPEFMF